MSAKIPTSKDVVDFLNARFEEAGLPYRVHHIAVLPYVSPMWLANWDVPQLDDAPDKDAIADIIRDAQWHYPQVLEEY